MEQEFEVPDDALFDAFSSPVTSISLRAMEHTDSTSSFCINCRVAMNIVGVDYQCDMCGYITSNESLGEPDREASGGRIRITTGANKGRIRNVNNDYSRTQIKNIYDSLKQQQLHNTGANISLDVLLAAATQYNEIQKTIKNSDNPIKEKFVRRGVIKTEILAALIYFECIRQNNPRKRPTIATFMGLVVQGFSGGENTLRNLAADGYFTIPECDHIIGYTERYLEALRIEEPKYVAFVTAVVQRSIEKNICVSSRIESRVAGAIHIAVVHCKLSTTVTELETAADNTKKHTFMKFYKAVYANYGEFKDLFTLLD